MSSKITIMHTREGEHWYEETLAPTASNPDRNELLLQFKTENIQIEDFDDESLAFSLKNPDTDIYKAVFAIGILNKFRGETPIDEFVWRLLKLVKP